MGEMVTNSVQQILSSCESMMEESKGVEYVDIWSLTYSLKTQTDELKRVFDTEPENEKLLQAKKQIVEATAIRLEFYLAVRLGLYTDRYKMRKYAQKLYQDTRQIAIMISKDESQSGIVVDEWGARTRWALKFYARSQHILFEVDEEDEKKIKEIIDAMNALKGERAYA